MTKAKISALFYVNFAVVDRIQKMANTFIELVMPS